MSEGYGGYMLDIAIQMTAIWGRLQAPEITAEYGVTTTAGGWHGLIPSPFGLSLIHISEPRDRTRSRMPSSA